MSVHQTAAEKITTVAAGAATLSPWWLDGLSGWAAKLLPILGAGWLILQMARFSVNWWRGK